MNKLLFSEGGQPLYLDDLDFLQNSFADSVKGLASPFGNVILSGCVISSSDNKTSWTDGYLVIDGEIYKVDAGNISNPAPVTIYWKVVRTNEQLEVFENNSEKHVYQLGKAILVELVEQSDKYVDAKTIRTINSYLMSYKIKKFRCIPVHNNTEATMTLFENSQGFHVIKITFKVKSKISFTLQPLFMYDSDDSSDFNKVSGRIVVHTSGGSSTSLVAPMLIQQGAVYMYNSEKQSSLTLDEGFELSVTYTKTPI